MLAVFYPERECLKSFKGQFFYNEHSAVEKHFTQSSFESNKYSRIEKASVSLAF